MPAGWQKHHTNFEKCAYDLHENKCGGGLTRERKDAGFP